MELFQLYKNYFFYAQTIISNIVLVSAVIVMGKHQIIVLSFL